METFATQIFRFLKINFFCIGDFQLFGRADFFSFLLLVPLFSFFLGCATPRLGSVTKKGTCGVGWGGGTNRTFFVLTPSSGRYPRSEGWRIMTEEHCIRVILPGMRERSIIIGECNVNYDFPQNTPRGRREEKAITLCSALHVQHWGHAASIVQEEE